MLLQWSVLLRVETLLVLLSLLLMFITGPPTSCRGPVLCYCSLASVVVCNTPLCNVTHPGQHATAGQ